MSSPVVLAVAFNMFTVVAATCTPIFPGCVCKTVNLECNIFDDISVSIAQEVWKRRTPGTTKEELKAASDALKADPANRSKDAGNFIGGLVRLAFHDVAEYSPTSNDLLRGDGCVNLQNPQNAGLAPVIELLDALWKPYCSKVSRADFWNLAAKIAIEESTPYIAVKRGRLSILEDSTFDVSQEFKAKYASSKTSSEKDKKKKNQGRTLLRGEETMDWFVLPFRYGREDVVDCSYPPTDNRMRLPDAEKGPREIERTLMKNFNLDAAHATALMGAHTLGRCEVNNSGYNSSWKDRSDLFTTHYFKSLVVSKWDRAEMRHPFDNRVLYQWNLNSKSAREQGSMMLASDMVLMYAVDPSHTQTFGDSCGPLEKEERKKKQSDRCPRTSTVYPDLEFDKYVIEYAEGSTDTLDEPGASKWLSAFARAWKNMSEAGYGPKELVCAGCAQDICPNCSSSILCDARMSPLPDNATKAAGDTPGITESSGIQPEARTQSPSSTSGKAATDSLASMSSTARVSKVILGCLLVVPVAEM